MPFKVAIATNTIPDYRYIVFRDLIKDERYRFRFFVSLPKRLSCARAQAEFPLYYTIGGNLRFSTKHSGSGTVQDERLPIPLLLWLDLMCFWPKIIVSGDLGTRSLISWATARLIGARFVIWSEEIGPSAAGRSRLQLRLRQFLARRADAFLAWGRPAEDYLGSLRVEKKRIFRCAQAIDHSYWQERAEVLERDQQRKILNLEGTVFLLVGRLVDRKGFRSFLEAWSRAGSESAPNSIAVIVGSGEQGASLREYAHSKQLCNVRFVDALSPDELSRYYAAADIFVFPSLEDVWGLVVNEALCFGLPVLGSRFAGSTQGLLRGSRLGVEFDPTDIESFAAHLTALRRAPPVIDRAEGHRVIEEVTFEYSRKVIKDLLDVVGRQNKAGTFTR